MGEISGFLMKFSPLLQCLLSLLERIIVKLPMPFEKLEGGPCYIILDILSFCGGPCLLEERWSDDPLGSVHLESIQIPCSWQPPPIDTLKFNVDGAAKSDFAGCGGILRNAASTIQALFSGQVSPLGADFVELTTILVALDLFVEVDLSWKSKLIIESDSLLVITWTLHSDSRPWRLWKEFLELDRKVDKIQNVSFKHVSRQYNEMADFLAKAGMERSELSKAWW
ncbi:hypothetical protein V6N11_017913 [Hibiscus sabdariffa]|uniref:RNase H type-1 domain-containing protein n=1 Tax=Hibiscus sabdariffa TaxID=183260 RepID=A0ABR2T6G4_9ROSI